MLQTIDTIEGKKKMPSRIKTQCTEPYCTNFAEKGTKCNVHRRETEKNYINSNANYKAKKKIYSSGRWKRVRDIVLRNNPACAKCGRLAEEVDHILPYSMGGEMFDLANLQALCKECHYQKTYLDSKRNKTS